MGLSIHYRFDFVGSAEEVLGFVTRLHAAAELFGAGELTPVGEFVGDAAKFERGRDDEDSILKLSAASWVMSGQRPVCVDPIRFVGFVLLPGDGCEPAAFGLSQFPSEIEADGTVVATELGDGWHWVAHCKTQYASNPECGGIPNFLRCHLSICAVLEKAREFGATVEVQDESEFWRHRSMDKLAEAVTRLNQLTAGLVGAMKDEEGVESVVGAIQSFSNFEHLEAEAMSDPKLAESLRQITKQLGKSGAKEGE